MLTRLDIHNVRNLESIRLVETGRVNVLFGANGSGKTSVLEAIHMLSMARSFRATSARSVIRHGEDQCTVYGELGHTASNAVRALGVQRWRSGEASLKVAGKPVKSVASLVTELPVLVINADGFGLLTGSPAERRRFLDWGVFHVEHPFFAAWQRFQRCIRQRNTVLRRDKIDDGELSVWTREITGAGEALSACRRRYFERLVPAFERVVAGLLPDVETLSLRFRQGWEAGIDYAEALERSARADREQGFTHVGPQRADIGVYSGRHAAAETLSRGQQKLVICAMKLAQGYVLAETTGSGNCTYLVDDLPSELDTSHAARVCEQLDAIGAQAFITCIEAPAVERIWPSSATGPQMFHVEHGKVGRPTDNYESPKGT
jgi:DNA replication and repair protein RecF